MSAHVDALQSAGLGETTIDHAPEYPREVLRRTLKLDATALILVHNHPSGDATPSRADIEMTQQFNATAKSLGIVLHNHLIITRSEKASFTAMGLLKE